MLGQRSDCRAYHHSLYWYTTLPNHLHSSVVQEASLSCTFIGSTDPHVYAILCLII